MDKIKQKETDINKNFPTMRTLVAHGITIIWVEWYNTEVHTDPSSFYTPFYLD